MHADSMGLKFRLRKAHIMPERDVPYGGCPDQAVLFTGNETGVGFVLYATGL